MNSEIISEVKDRAKSLVRLVENNDVSTEQISFSSIEEMFRVLKVERTGAQLKTALREKALILGAELLRQLSALNDLKEKIGSEPETEDYYWHNDDKLPLMRYDIVYNNGQRDIQKEAYNQRCYEVCWLKGFIKQLNVLNNNIDDNKKFSLSLNVIERLGL